MTTTFNKVAFKATEIIARITALVKAYAANDYELYDGDKDEALTELEDAFKDMLAYANHVISQQYSLPMAYARYEGEQLRDYVKASDTTRRRLHLAACASINMVNRICKMSGVEEIFPGVNASEDNEGRRQAAIAIGCFISNLYNHGIGLEDPDRAFDAATYNRNGKQYDPKKVDAAIEEMVG